MAKQQGAKYKTKEKMATLLQAALNMEKEKYRQYLVKPDLAHEYVDAQAWGYVVAGYFLVEEAFKAILHIRGNEVPTTHSLQELFDRFDEDDKKILRECYTDYKATIGGRIALFPVDSLDDFLVKLDGDKIGSGKKKRETYVGSFDWRYFLIEERQSEKMPIVSVDYMHEIVHVCVEIVLGSTITCRSLRMHHERRPCYHRWFKNEMSSENWNESDDRIEILWGPDYQGRYDLLRFKEKQITPHFSSISNIQSSPPLPVIDRREEITDFFRKCGYGPLFKK